MDFDVAGGIGAPATARRELARRLASRIDEDDLYEVNLLLSELVTNAVRHGDAGEDDRVEIDVRLGADRIRVGVTDSGPGFERPARPRARPGGAGGNGLPLLQQISAEWDVERGKGTTVWFEMPLKRAA
jgi:anti-sigma regulatory factor (Ser/Thr protein kinase)